MMYLFLLVVVISFAVFAWEDVIPKRRKLYLMSKYVLPVVSQLAALCWRLGFLKTYIRLMTFSTDRLIEAVEFENERSRLMYKGW